MATYSPRLSRLIEALRRLPGVGPKSAQRMAFHLLDRDRDGAAYLTTTLAEALTGIERCPSCRVAPIVVVARGAALAHEASFVAPM